MQKMPESNPTAGSVAGGKSAGVSIPECMVAPLIGAGANVYILTNELTQSMRAKLGTSLPFLQDTLNSRYAKLLAGGVLASVATIIFWKIIKRLCKPKPPTEREEEALQWTGTKTFEVMPVPETYVKAPGTRAEGEAVVPMPIHMLPHKIQLRIAEAPLVTTRAQETPDALLCKAREAATRNRHTRHREQPGEPSRGDPHSPWHSEQRECACRPEGCGPVAPQPRLLYSLRESRVVQRALDLSDPRLVKLLTYASSPSSLCPAVLGQPSAGLYPASPCGPTLVPHTPGLYSMPEYLAPRVPTSLYPFPDSVAHHCPYHVEDDAQSLLPAASCSRGSARCAMQTTGPVYVHSGANSLPGVDASTCQRVTAGAESRARSVCQQTDGNPVEEDLDMPSHTTHTHHTAVSQTGHVSAVQTQHVPTRAAQSSVTPSQYTSVPFQSDHAPTHLHSALPCPSQPPHLPQSCQMPASPYHAHTFLCPTAQQAQAQLQALSYHQHSSLQQQQMMHQRQSPVVQEASDSSMSQDSSELSSSQDRQRDGGRGNAGGQATSPPDVVPRDGVPLRPEPLGAGCYAPHSSPSPRAIADYAHSDFPWRGPSSLHSYQPTPVYVIGIQAPHPHHLPHHPSWPTPAGMFMPPIPTPAGLFMPPCPASHPAGLFGSSAAGMFPHVPPGLFTSPSPGQLFMSQFQNPYNPFLYPQPPMPESKPMAFNPNFNLSNSNPLVYVQQAAHHRPSVARFFPESGKVRVVESNHSINTDNTGRLSTNTPSRVSAATWTSEEDMLSSDVAPLQHSDPHVALQTEVSTTEPSEEFPVQATEAEVNDFRGEVSASATNSADTLQAHLAAADTLQAHLAAADTLQAHLAAADTLQAHLAAADTLQAHLAAAGPTEVFQAEVASSEPANVFQDEGASSELTNVFFAEAAAPDAVHLAATTTNTVASSDSSTFVPTEKFGTQL